MHLSQMKQSVVVMILGGWAILHLKTGKATEAFVDLPIKS